MRRIDMAGKRRGDRTISNSSTRANHIHHRLVRPEYKNETHATKLQYKIYRAEGGTPHRPPSVAIAAYKDYPNFISNRWKLSLRPLFLVRDDVDTIGATVRRDGRENQNKYYGDLGNKGAHPNYAHRLNFWGWKRLNAPKILIIRIGEFQLSPKTGRGESREAPPGILRSGAAEKASRDPSEKSHRTEARLPDRRSPTFAKEAIKAIQIYNIFTEMAYYTAPIF